MLVELLPSSFCSHQAPIWPQTSQLSRTGSSCVENCLHVPSESSFLSFQTANGQRAAPPSRRFASALSHITTGRLVCGHPVCLGEVLPITCKSGLDVCRHRRLGAIWAFQDAPGSKSMYWAPVSPLQTEATPVLYIPGFGVAMALPILSAADGPSLSRRKSLSYRARGITDEVCAPDCGH